MSRPEHINRKNGAGFTLIELLVVMACISLLSSIVMVNVNIARAKARDAARMADAKSMLNALLTDFYETGKLHKPPNNQDYATGLCTKEFAETLILYHCDSSMACENLTAEGLLPHYPNWLEDGWSNKGLGNLYFGGRPPLDPTQVNCVPGHSVVWSHEYVYEYTIDTATGSEYSSFQYRLENSNDQAVGMTSPGCTKDCYYNFYLRLENGNFSQLID